MSAAMDRHTPARAGRRASTLPITGSQPRVALYARYSSDRQSENSIEDQLRICRERVEREGWQLVRSYQDAAISGSTADRPGFIALQPCTSKACWSPCSRWGSRSSAVAFSPVHLRFLPWRAQQSRAGET